MNKRSKIRKIGVWTLIVLLSLTAILLLGIQIPAVQTYLVQKVSSSLSEQLGTEVSVGEVDVDLPDYAVLRDVLVRDQQGDTMFFVGELRAALRDLDRENHFVVLRTVEIDQPKVYFSIDEGESAMNLQFLIDFVTPENPDPNAPTWIIASDQVKLKDGKFVFHDKNLSYPTDRKFTENHIRISEINATMKNFVLVQDSLDFRMKDFNARDHSGLAITQLSARTKIFREGLHFDDMLLATEHSELRDRLIMSYSDYSTLGDFIDSVYIDAHLADAVIAVEDLAYFSDELERYANNSFALSTYFKGTVADFKATDVALNFATKGYFAGKVEIKGMPDWEKSIYKIDATRMVFEGDDLVRHFHVPEMPKEVSNLGIVFYRGKFDGLYNDFATKGMIRSEVGQLYTDLEFSMTDDAPESYSGEIIATHINLGRIIDDPSLGKTSFHLNISEGAGISEETIEAVFDGEVEYIQIAGYNYERIVMDGRFDGNRFEGTASIDDENASITFDGQADLNSKVPEYKFYADVKRLNLMELGFETTPTSVVTKITCDLSGAKVNDFEGNTSLYDIKVVREGRAVELDTVKLFATKTDTTRKLSLYSDIIDVQLSGKFDFDNFDRVSQTFLNDLFPEYYEVKKPLKKDVAIDLRFRVHKSDFIGTLLDSQFVVGPSVFVGNYSSAEKSLHADARVSAITVGDYHLDKISLNMIKEPEQLLFMSSDIARIVEGTSELTNKVVLNATVLPNEIDFMFDFADTTGEVALRSYGLASFMSDTVRIALEESRVYIRTKSWGIQPGNEIVYNDDNITVSNLILLSEDQEILINGELGESFDQHIDAKLVNFELDNLNPFLVSEKVEVQGITNGEIRLHAAMGRPVAHGEITTANLVFNGDTLGDVRFSAESSRNEPMQLWVEGQITKGILKDISMNGMINFNPEQYRMNISLNMDHGSVKPFEPFLGGEVTDLTGTASADVLVSGPIDAPRLEGEIQLHDVGMTMDYFKTRYTLRGPVYLDQTSIRMKNNAIIDSKGHEGKINGVVSHKDFDDFKLDIKVTELKDFVAMNTTKEDNDYFYGTAIADGRVEVSGPIDDVFVKVVAKSKAGTDIKIPLESENTNASASYITFVDLEKDQEDITQVRQKVEGFTMDLVFEVTPEAKISLIFDELTDDKITGKGSGNIRMEVNSYGDFYMFGDYVISEGSYPYNAYIISEEFNFEPGGRISWDGNPYEAVIDMDATVRKMADPKFLYGNVDDGTTYKPITVDCRMSISGNLFSPNIEFGFALPNLPSGGGPSNIKTRLKQLEENPDELNRQFFAVLAFGMFVPPSDANATANVGVGGVGTQTISNSVSGLMNKYVGEWMQNALGVEVGVNWNSTSAEERDQVMVEVQRKLLDDKLTLIGSGDAAGQDLSTNPFQFKATYDVSKDGRVKIFVFYQRANDLSISGTNNTTSQAGGGLYFRREMDRIRLFNKTEPEDDREKEN